MRPENLDLLGRARRGRIGRLGQELVVNLAPIETDRFGSCDRAYAAKLISTEAGDGAANGDLLRLRWLTEHQETDDKQPCSATIKTMSSATISATSTGGTPLGWIAACQARSRRRRWPERPGFTGGYPAQTMGERCYLR